MLLELEQKLIDTQFKMLRPEKRPKLSQIWSEFKSSIGEVK